METPKEIIPLDHVRVALLDILLENIFSDKNVCSTSHTFTYISITMPCRILTEKIRASLGFTYNVLLHLWEVKSAPSLALHRKHAPCCGESSCDKPQDSLSVQGTVQRQEEKTKQTSA
jgi:hypothetical protein